MNKLKTYSLLSIIGLFVIVIGQHVPVLNFIFLLYSLIVIAISLPLPGLINNLSARMLSAILLSAAFFQIEGLLFWISHLHISYVIYPLTLFFAAQVLFALATIRESSINKNLLVRLRPCLIDITILGAGAIICSLVLIGDFRINGFNQGSIIQSVGFGLDDGSHISMFGDELRADANLLLGSKSATTFPGFSAYPKGWHLTTAIYTIAISPHDYGSKSLTHLVDSYFIAKNVTLFLTVSSFSLCLYTIRRILSPAKSTWLLDAFIIISFSLLISMVLVMPFYWEGFFNFLPAIIYGLLFLVFFSVRWDEVNRSFLFLYMSLCVIGSALTWLLAAPALFGSLIFALPTQQSFNLRPKQLVDYLRKNSIYYLLVLVTFCIILTQILVQIIYNNGVTSLASPGGISQPAPIFAVAILLGFVIFSYRRATIHIAHTIMWWLFPLLLLTGTCLMYQLLKGSGASYYFYKLEILLLIFASIPAFALFSDLLPPLSIERNKQYLSMLYQGALFTTVLTVFIIGTTNYESLSTSFKQLAGRREISFYTAQVIQNISLDHSFSNGNNRLFFIYPKDKPKGIIASHLARLSHPIDGCDDRLFNDIYANAVSTFETDINTCILNKGYNYTIYTDPETKQSIQAVLNSSIQPNTITAHDVAIIN